MSKDITEYAVRVDREEGSELDAMSVTTDIGDARKRKAVVVNRESLYAKAAGKKPAAVKLVMRTCTPWCEVCEDDPFKRKAGNTTQEAQ